MRADEGGTLAEEWPELLRAFPWGGGGGGALGAGGSAPAPPHLAAFGAACGHEHAHELPQWAPALAGGGFGAAGSGAEARFGAGVPASARAAAALTFEAGTSAPAAPPPGALLRCLDATHAPGCARCTPPPEDAAAAEWVLAGDKGAWRKRERRRRRHAFALP
jgi:hypothetical protein